MFVNNATGQRGLVCQYDVVCFDEVSGVSFDQKDGVNIMKGYMESGELSRGKESIRADGSIVLVGNFEVDVEHQQRIGHLFGPLPPEMRDDTAFMDRIHAYLPGWDVPKMQPTLFTDHFGLVSDFLSECFSRLRMESRLAHLQGKVHLGGALSGRDINATNKTASGLRILNKPTPPTFQESVRYAQQNLYARAAQLVGDRDPRAHELSVQLRSFDAAKTGSQIGVASLIALCSSLLKKPLRGGLVVIGEINLGGSIEPIHNAVTLVEMAVEKGAQAVLMPITSRRQLFDLPDDMATKVDTQFYQDARDALLKALVE
jgi:predicted ATP-dependent Lon-type protease